MAAGLLAGSCAVLSLPQAPPVALVWAGLCASVAGAWAWRKSWLLGPGVGFWLTALQLNAGLSDRLNPALEGQPVRMRGVVTSVPQGTLDVLKFRFSPLPDGDSPLLPQVIELTWYDAPARIEAAETLELEVKLRRPRGFANPGGYDNEARMLRDRVGASGYVRSGERLGRGSNAAFKYPVLLARAQVASIIRDALGARPSAGIVTGLAVGLQDALSREQWLQLSRSGTSHLMAISGLHIAMVAAVFAWLGGRVQRVRQRRGATGATRDASVVAAAVAALGYSLLAGWSVPTQRTMVMIACGAAALLLRRRIGVADGLGFCVAGVLLLDPLAPLAPGFWLSFGAVVVILYGATGHVRPLGLIRGYLLVQVVVTLGLVPVLAGSFGSVSLVSALVNLYAIPLYTLLIVPAVLVSCAVAIIAEDAGTVMLDWTGRLIESTWPLIEVPASWPLATWSIAGLDGIAWVALILGTLAALSPLPIPGRVAGGVLIATACLWRPALVPDGVARVTILDVGQGLSVVIETRGHTLVYDAGPSFRTGSDTGQLVVVPYLRSRGIRTVDRVVVSHDDDDHKGGAGSVLVLMDARALTLGPSLRASAFNDTRAQRTRDTCRRGEAWAWNGVDFRWVHPGDARYQRDNDSSCVLLVSAGGHAALITGDIEAEAERELVREGALAPVDIVVVPHHGSRTSSTQDFVAASRPRWAVYAVGYRNRWNFPVLRVVERWEQAGAQGVRTSDGGAITFELAPGRALAPPSEWRREHLRPWRDP
ncbi:MAG: DNA internalization-related competence protein ComEC/Rec2 [Steroidobacteraceae bacterium]